MKEELFIPKTKYKGLKIFIVLLLIIGIIGGGGYYYYKNYFNNPNYIVTKALDKSIKNIGKENINIGEKEEINGLIKVKLNLGNELKNITDVINNMNIQLNGNFDTKEKIYNFDIFTKYKDKEFVDANIYSENNTVYIKLGKLYDKYIELGKIEEVLESDIKINVDDTKKITEGILNAFKGALDKQTFERTQETINVGKKEYSAYNNYLLLKDNEINKFLKEVLTNLKNDSNFVSSCTKVFGNDFSNQLNETIKGLDQEEIKGSYKISFYTTGLVNQKLISIRQEIDDNEQKIYFIGDIIDNDEIEISVTDNKGTELSIHLKLDNKKINFEIKAKAMDMEAEMEVNLNVQKIDKVNKVDVSNSKKIEELDEKDMTIIDENLANNNKLIEVVNEIMGMMSRNEV